MDETIDGPTNLTKRIREKANDFKRVTLQDQATKPHFVSCRQSQASSPTLRYQRRVYQTTICFGTNKVSPLILDHNPNST